MSDPVRTVDFLVWGMDLKLTLGMPEINAAWGDAAATRARGGWKRTQQRARPRWQSPPKPRSGNWQERRR